MLKNEFEFDEPYMSFKEEIKDGNELSFRELYNHVSKQLIAFAISMVKERDAAFEIVDDVFVRLWQNRANICAINNIRVYLYKAVKNTSLNYISKKAKENITEPFDHIDVQLNNGVTPENKMIMSEIYEKIDSAVKSLPPRCKIIFKLVREDGLKYKEVAEILNISENTVDAQMVIAVHRITEAVRSEFHFTPSVRSKKTSKKL
jgi:RNA polymerase sigma-70 factor (ECF subfamily)